METTPIKTLAVWLITVPIFFLIDGIWLGGVARGFYQRHLGSLLRPDVNWTVAAGFYLLFVVGLVIFAVQPALNGQSALHALLYGALFGLVTYATYDLTNLATLRNWPAIVTVVDLAWGTVLCGVVAWTSYTVSNRLL